MILSQEENWIHELAEDIYKALNEKGAKLGNVSIFIIEQTIEKYLAMKSLIDYFDRLREQ